jgi:hypothetical protein
LALAGDPLALVLALDRVFMIGWIPFSWR